MAAKHIGKHSLPSARSLRDAANSENSLEGYAAMNANDPDHDDIARLAYQLWEESGRPHGAAEEHWFQAEEELRRQRAGREHASI